MNELIEKLLQPISAEQPCGPDLSGEARFDELAVLLRGIPEVEIGNVKKPAEPPDWRELREQSSQFLRDSKHLRVAVMLCGSLIQAEGFAGFRDGLQLVGGLVEQYWSMVYPLLDPEDSNDPTERLNILKVLTEPRGSLAVGWLTILDYLNTAPLFGAKAVPAVTFDQLRAAKQSSGGAGLEGAIRNAGPAKIAVPQQCLQQTLDALRRLDQFLTTTLGKENTISFEVLELALKEMLALLQPFLSGATEGDDATVATGAAAIPGAEGGTTDIKVKGAIRSSNDVVRAIEQICEYYRQVEPSSPVPYLLRRAQKLAKMDFVQVVQELNLATAETLRPSMGSALPTNLSQPGGESPAAAA
jgi:type VI secretion system protein ImpA